MKKVFLQMLFSIIVSSCMQEETIIENNYDNIYKNTHYVSATAESQAYGRKLTSEEKDFLTKWFPNLSYEIDQVRVFCDTTSSYNCIGHAMGLSQWIPIPKPQSLGVFNDLFLNPSAFGWNPPNKFKLCECYSLNAIVDGWGTSTNNMMHASLRSSGNTWSSKIGKYLGITHTRSALESNAYGQILTSFIYDSMYSINISKEDIDTIIPKIGKYELDLLAAQVSNVKQELRDKFNFIHNEWYKTANNTPEILISSVMESWEYLPQFDELVSMGEPIIPLIIEKLTHEEYFFTQLVYEAIKPNAKKMLIPSYDENGKILIESAQVRAKRYVKNWIEYNL